MNHKYNPGSPGGITLPDVCEYCKGSGYTIYVHVAGIGGTGLLCRKCKKEFEGIEEPRAKGKKR